MAAIRIGTTLSFLANYYQEHLYRRKVATRGPEARLYAAMLGGILFAVGCFIYAWTCECGISRVLCAMLTLRIAFPHVTYIAPCIGITVLVFGIFSI